MWDKLRSLSCGLMGGLRFRDLDGRSTITFTDFPLELEHIARAWVQTVPMESRVQFANDQLTALTEVGWRAFISWLVLALGEVVQSGDFEGSVLRSLAHDADPFDFPFLDGGDA